MARRGKIFQAQRSTRCSLASRQTPMLKREFVRLDLGEVGGQARVMLNGEELGTLIASAVCD